jgi:uncharacterized peroxidase-related enzyme
MSRLSVINPEEASGQVEQLFAGIKKAIGKVPNVYVTMGTHSAAALGSILQADSVLSHGSLVATDVEAIKLVVSEIVGCDYCLAAHTLIGRKKGLSSEEMQRIRAGERSGNERRDTLLRFVRRVVLTRGTVPEDIVAEVRAAGYTEQQLIEVGLAISVITFANIVNRVNDTTVDFPAAPAIA